MAWGLGGGFFPAVVYQPRAARRRGEAAELTVQFLFIFRVPTAL